MFDLLAVKRANQCETFSDPRTARRLLRPATGRVSRPRHLAALITTLAGLDTLRSDMNISRSQTSVA